jgi:phosphomannomutase
VIRPSGTEPVIRVMAQGEDEALLVGIVDEICEAILAEPADTETIAPFFAAGLRAAE